MAKGHEAPDPFDRRLERARGRAGLDPAPGAGGGSRATPSADPHPLAYAARLGVEMAASLAVACAIGYGLDRWLGTKPWLMIVLMPVGVAAGVRNLMRSVSPPARSAPPAPGGAAGPEKGPP